MKNVIMKLHMVLHSQGSLPGRHARSKFQLWMGGGEGSNSDNATSPDEAINLGRHSENISVVDDTMETSILMAYDTHKDEKRKFADDLD